MDFWRVINEFYVLWIDGVMRIEEEKICWNIFKGWGDYNICKGGIMLRREKRKVVLEGRCVEFFFLMKVM